VSCLHSDIQGLSRRLETEEIALEQAADKTIKGSHLLPEEGRASKVRHIAFVM
jgi:hypothetical protein